MMVKLLKLFLRGFVVIFRDAFIGLLMGICSAVFLYKIYPDTLRVVGILMPAGIVIGAFKGFIKFMFLNLFSHIPSKGYRYNYPKFKLLLVWVIVFLGTMVIALGFKINKWFYEPFVLLKENVLVGNVGPVVWITVFLGVFIIGLWAHLYEPPINEEEALPVIEEQEES